MFLLFRVNVLNLKLKICPDGIILGGLVVFFKLQIKKFSSMVQTVTNEIKSEEKIF